MEGIQRRRPRFRRTSEIPPIRLTERDRTILRHVREHRFLQTSHILRLVPGSKQNLSRRLQLLYHHGYLDRPRAQLPSFISGELREIVYGLDQKGASVREDDSPRFDGVTSSESEIGDVSGLFLAHTLSIADVMVAFEAACRLSASVRIIKMFGSCRLTATPGIAENQFHWHVTLRTAHQTERIGLIPDSTFALEFTDEAGESRRSYFFLEADRGTMPVKRQRLVQSSIYRKALAYIESRRSGIVYERYGFPAFRVVFVTKSRERMQNMMQVCKEANGNRNSAMFLFTTQADISESESILSLPWQTTNGEYEFLV